MPNADDLQVVVSADTAKLEAGFNKAKTIISSFDQNVGSLGKLDNSVGSIVGTIGKLTSILGVATAAYSAWMLIGSQALAAVGMEKQFDQVKGALDGLLVTLAEALPAAFAAAARAASGATGQMSADTKKSVEVQLTWWERVRSTLESVRDGARGVVAGWKDPATLSLQEQAALMADLRQQVDYINERAAGMFAKPRGDAIDMQDAMLGVAAQVGGLFQQIDSLSESIRERNRAGGMSRPDALFEGMIKDLHRQIETSKELLKAATLGAEAQEAVRKRIEAERSFKSAGRTMTGDERATINNLIAENEALERNARLRKEAKEKAEEQAKAIERIMAGGEREIQQLENKANRLTMTARAAAELEMEERLLLALRSRGIEATPEYVARIKALSEAYAAQTEHVRLLERQMEMLRETGQVVASTLENAFGSWMNGTAINWRNMIQSMIADLAKMALRRSVLEPLLGGGDTKGGGLLGSLFASMFGGFFADGGPVAAGKVHVVGERGPELFVPQGAGAIVPNHALRGGGGVSVTVINQIDASGAYPESIEQIRAAMRGVEERVPGQVIQTVREAQERGGL